MKIKRLLKGGTLLLGLLCLCCGLAPLVFRVFHAGSVGLILYGGSLLFVLLYWNQFDTWGKIPRRLRAVSDHRRPKPPVWWIRLRWGIICCLILGAVGGSAISVPMIRAAWFNPPPENSTVIVLGCQAVDGRPSVMLQKRLDVALVYLQNNPSASVICTGGIDDLGETFSEAQVMAQYLMEQGIAGERIFREDLSRNTLKNLENAEKIIVQKGLSRQVAVATDGFHQLRGQLYAAHFDLEAYGLPCNTPWGLFPGYWVREWMGLAKAVFVDL